MPNSPGDDGTVPVGQCPECGGAVPDGARVCPGCYRRCDVAHGDSLRPTRKMAVLWGLCALAIALAAVIGASPFERAFNRYGGLVGSEPYLLNCGSAWNVNVAPAVCDDGRILGRTLSFGLVVIAVGGGTLGTALLDRRRRAQATATGGDVPAGEAAAPHGDAAGTAAAAVPADA